METVTKAYMRSLRPKEYARLPRLKAPAAYVCVIRDIEKDRYRIQACQLPAALAQDSLSEAGSAFGIELLAILECGDIAASAEALYQAHHAELSDAWLALDQYQLEELRRSALRIDDHASCYLSASTKDAQPQTAPRPPRPQTRRRAFGQYQRPSRRLRAGPSLVKPYGRRAPDREDRAEEAETLLTKARGWRQAISDRVDELMWNRPGLVIGFMLLVMLMCLAYLWRNPYAMW